MKIDWRGMQVYKKAQEFANEAAEEGAKLIQQDARQILMSKAQDPTGKLASEIDIRKSKFEDGGWLVEAQGKGRYTRYYARFVELGTWKMAPIPFLRPALKMNKAKIRRLYMQRFWS